MSNLSQRIMSNFSQAWTCESLLHLRILLSMIDILHCRVLRMNNLTYLRQIPVESKKSRIYTLDYG
jgi:hypothetical protein